MEYTIISFGQLVVILIIIIVLQATLPFVPEFIFNVLANVAIIYWLAGAAGILENIGSKTK